MSDNSLGADADALITAAVKHRAIEGQRACTHLLGVGGSDLETKDLRALLVATKCLRGLAVRMGQEVCSKQVAAYL